MVEQKPDLEALFPGKRRRKLVEEFVEKVSSRPGVEKVISVDIGTDKPHQRVMVMTEGAELGIPTSAEMDEVMGAFFLTCQTPYQQNLLGHVPAITESLFEEDRKTVNTLIGKEVNVLWEKPKEPGL